MSRLAEAILKVLPELEPKFLNKNKLDYQLGICEGRKQMLKEVKEAIKKVEFDEEKIEQIILEYMRPRKTTTEFKINELAKALTQADIIKEKERKD